MPLKKETKQNSFKIPNMLLFDETIINYNV